VEKFGIGIIKNIWEHIRYNDPIPSINMALESFGENVETVFPEFTIWNYFTDGKADTIYHNDGIDYPPIVIDQTVASCPFAGITANNPPDGLASNYIVSYPDTTQNGLLNIDFDGVDMVAWGFSYIILKDNTISGTSICSVNTDGETICGIYDFIYYDSIVFIPSVVSQWHNNNEYVFTTEIHPFGDADGSGELNLLDITHIINYLYKSGLPPKHDYYMGDPNCSGAINILDVSYLINYLYRGGPEPCVFRP
jgi:hypothetical protein